MRFPALSALFVACGVVSLLLEIRRAPEHWEYLREAAARGRGLRTWHLGLFLAFLFMTFTGPIMLCFELGLLLFSAYYALRHRIAVWCWEREFPLCPKCHTHHKSNPDWACWIDPCLHCGLVHTGDVPCPGMP
jgi:hypothetical protein